jgi:hypothetical protein
VIRVNQKNFLFKLKYPYFAETIAFFTHFAFSGEAIVFASALAGWACFFWTVWKQASACSTAFFASYANQRIGFVYACSVTDFAFDLPVSKMDVFKGGVCCGFQSGFALNLTSRRFNITLVNC